MATKQQVIDLNQQHPDWTARQIAECLGCNPVYVHASGNRYGLTFAKPPRRHEDPNCIYALGREARRAGLTIETIRKVAREMRVR